MMQMDPPVKKSKLLAEEASKRKRLFSEPGALERLYCPCAGFAYNSLTGDRNVLVSVLGQKQEPLQRRTVIVGSVTLTRCPDEQCKHLLAVIIALKLGKEVRTSVGLQGLVSLLGLGGIQGEGEEGDRIGAAKHPLVK